MAKKFTQGMLLEPGNYASCTKGSLAWCHLYQTCTTEIDSSLSGSSFHSSPLTLVLRNMNNHRKKEMERTMSGVEKKDVELIAGIAIGNCS